ncbi:hypothetical protein [Borrelia sp. RT1S]|nr:hypothetical protein [Borrelia sp. RT1S]WLT67908.1 hypothetical protein LSO05_06225 [Borrelia sp. RT1S]
MAFVLDTVSFEDGVYVEGFRGLGPLSNEDGCLFYCYVLGDSD